MQQREKGFYLFYVLRGELGLLQTDGSCSSLALGMTIHGLVCALKLGWIEVVWEESVLAAPSSSTYGNFGLCSRFAFNHPAQT